MTGKTGFGNLAGTDVSLSIMLLRDGFTMLGGAMADDSFSAFAILYPAER